MNVKSGKYEESQPSLCKNERGRYSLFSNSMSIEIFGGKKKKKVNLLLNLGTAASRCVRTFDSAFKFT